jgi:hypothetical protein
VALKTNGDKQSALTEYRNMLVIHANYPRVRKEMLSLESNTAAMSRSNCIFVGRIP